MSRGRYPRRDTMFETATATLDWIGVIVFTVTGALAASRKAMDFVGFAVLGTATGIGGGTLRDLLLGLPVFWTVQPAYLLTCLIVSGAVFFYRPHPAVPLSVPAVARCAWSGAVRRGRGGEGPAGRGEPPRRHRHGCGHGHLRRGDPRSSGR
ncbi:membrane protein of unknown function [Methylorubrum extorquens]|uniref:Glycine transporter domain-containing protein n=1 Tax=Methylorubrum extorquens TaxID=408 RepID=A0A2N9AZC9_METEX|nr:membrane protein of unknown function [Methylorubrum extorquens]